MSRLRNRGPADRFLGSVALTAITLTVLIMAQPAFAAQVVLTSGDLPYRAKTGDTITISGTSISSATNGIEFKGGVHDIVIDGDPDGDGTKDTIIFNTGGASSNFGIRCYFDSWYGYIHDITIKNIVVKQYDHGDPATGQSCMGLSMTGTKDALFENVDVHVYSRNALCVYNTSSTGSFRVRFEGGSYTNHSVQNTNRCSYLSAAMILGTAHTDSGRVCDDPDEFNFSVRNATITSHGPGVCVFGKVYVVGNTITGDVRNTLWDEAQWGEQGFVNDEGMVLNVCAGSANGYGILASGITAGSRIDSNTVTSGTDWGGSRGIMVENSEGTQDCWIQLTGNDVDVHEGADKYYGDGADYEGRAFTMRDLDGGTCRYVHVFDNTFKTTAMNIDYDTVAIDTMLPYTASQSTFKMQSGYSGVDKDGDGCHFLIENNTFTAYSIDSGCLSVPLKIYSNPMDSTIIFRNNTYETDMYMVYYRAGDSLILRNPTFKRLTPNYSDTTFYWLQPGLDWSCGDHEIIDPTYTDGAEESVTFYSSNQGTNDIRLKRTLSIAVEGGLNGEPVVGAHVTVKNAYGNIVLDRYSGTNGMATGEVSYRYESRSGSDSTNFNDFTIIATSGDDADTVVHTVAWNTSVPPLVLPNTEGGGSWEMGTVQVQIDPRRVNDTIFVDVTNGSSPLGDSVIVCFSVTGYPDSSYAGRKAITYNPSGASRLYWTITGTEQYTVYISAWVRDNSGNWSGRVTTTRGFQNTAPMATF